MNFSGVLDSYIDKITIYSEMVKEFNSTYLGNPGSFYNIENEDIIWSSNFQISNPSEYQTYSLEIHKPEDWGFTSIRDSYDQERLSSCLGTGLGSNKTIIPESIIQTGLWDILAKSENYLTDINVAVWNTSSNSFINQTKLWFKDLFQINFSLNNSINPINTKINLLLADFEDIRIILVLQKEASEMLKKKVKELAKRCYYEISDLLESFSGVITPIKKLIEPLIIDTILLYYKEPF
jgi:hypothetical protein